VPAEAAPSGSLGSQVTAVRCRGRFAIGAAPAGAEDRQLRQRPDVWHLPTGRGRRGTREAPLSRRGCCHFSWPGLGIVGGPSIPGCGRHPRALRDRSSTDRTPWRGESKQMTLQFDMAHGASLLVCRS